MKNIYATHKPTVILPRATRPKAWTGSHPAPPGWTGSYRPSAGGWYNTPAAWSILTHSAEICHLESAGRDHFEPHRTYHLQGPEADLDLIAKATLGATIAEIEAAFSTNWGHYHRKWLGFF